MPVKRVRVDITEQQLARLRTEVFSKSQLSGEQRRKTARGLISLPSTGAPVDFFFQGRFVGAL